MKGRKLFGLFGAGGFGREVMPIFKELSQSFAGLDWCGHGADAAFVVTQGTSNSVNGYPVYSDSQFFSIEADQILFNVAVADSKIRQQLVLNCLEKGATPLTLISPKACTYDNNAVGEGAVICAFATVTSNARIGRFFHCNIYSYVAHDCEIGDFVTFAPNVRCNGNVRIGDHAYIGTGAIIRNGKSGRPLLIGEGAVVGMGSVVTKDVPPFVTVVGNPARQLPPRV